MTISFVPGEPNKNTQAVAQAQWRAHSIMAYCSGNNLIILSDDMQHLQTIYLDADATSVDINHFDGTIAVALGAQVQIYEPMNEFMKQPRWQLSTRLIDQDNHSQVNVVNWGVKEELIVGSDYLTLWQVKKEYGIVKPSIIWSLKQAAPVYIAKISQDSNLIASCTKYDKLLKVWNRISFGENSLFDLSYVLHPASITSIRWKRYDPDTKPDYDTFTNTLYTLSRDSILRIWSSHEYENSHMIQQWGSLDLFDGSCQEKKEKKFVNVIDDYLVTNALKASINKLYKEQNIEIQKKQPDIVTVADSHGNCELYALENLSQNPPKMINIKQLKTIRLKPKTFVTNPEFVNFAESLNDKNGDISIVIHDINGVIRNVIMDLSFLLDENVHSDIGVLAHKLTGHNKSIQRIFRTSDGSAMLTTSRFEENAVWVPQRLTDSLTLSKKSIVKTPSTLSMAILMDKGNRLLTISSTTLILWDTSSKIAVIKSQVPVNEDSELLLFAQVPIHYHYYDHSKHYVIAIYENCTKAWNVSDEKILEMQVDDLPIETKDIQLIAPIDPVGAVNFRGRPVLSTSTSDGVIQCFAGVVEDEKIHWIEKCHLESGISNPSYIRGSSISKFAIVDDSKKKLTIWDLNRNVLEFEENYDDVIRDIDWTCTSNKQSILAVGFDDHSLLYTQLRYDYTNKSPPFLAIKKIDIKSYTSHSIGDSIWLEDGTLIIGAGNQIFISDKTLDMENDQFTKKSIGSRNIVSNDILNLCSVLNGTLPLYHPQLLIQSLFIGKYEVVNEILLRLFLRLREIELSGQSINSIGSTLGFDITKFYEPNYIPSDDYEEPYTTFDDNVAELLKEKVANHSLPYLTRHQQMTLLSTIEAVQDIQKNLKILDHHGLRFYLGVKLYQLHRGGVKLTMRDINWALHSENKELLLQIIETSVKDRKITWSIALQYGLTHWVTYDNLVQTFESIARNEFLIHEKRDPSNCAIYYLALKKKQILLGLWRTSVGHPEQQKMLSFLKNDFNEPRWRSAALKNAFVLLSKHRYMLAACFFLLANSLKDCVNVLIKQVNDFDLAVGVCRVYEGDNGPVLKDILTKIQLPKSVSAGDRWTTSYVFWKIRDQSRAIQSLVKSPIECVSEEEKKGIVLTEHSRSFLEDDPLLVVLYKSLREKSVHYLSGSLEISPKKEFEFITRVSSIYTRMGCDYLSVDLVKNWKFVKSDGIKKEKSYVDLSVPTTASSGGSLLEKYGLSPSARRRESIISSYQQRPNGISNGGSGNGSGNGMSILEKYGLASNSIQKGHEEEKEKQTAHKNTAQPPPSAFKEPDMDSFQFGF